MNFDYTYIIFLGKIIFEPVTILTNLFIAVFCLFAFIKCIRFKTKLSAQWSWFFMLIGISSIIGSVVHGVHYQAGDLFLRSSIFLMNAVSLIAIYFCFKAANLSLNAAAAGKAKYVNLFVISWIMVLLAVTFIQNNFLLVKIHAGIVLTYSLIIHFITYKKPGSALIAWGIIISFFSIIVHSLRLSVSEWFNYKDIAHIIMVISLAVMYKGIQIKLKSEKNKSLVA